MTHFGPQPPYTWTLQPFLSLFSLVFLAPHLSSLILFIKVAPHAFLSSLLLLLSTFALESTHTLPSHVLVKGQNLNTIIQSSSCHNPRLFLIHYSFQHSATPPPCITLSTTAAFILPFATKLRRYLSLFSLIACKLYALQTWLPFSHPEMRSHRNRSKRDSGRTYESELFS